MVSKPVIYICELHADISEIIELETFRLFSNIDSEVGSCMAPGRSRLLYVAVYNFMRSTGV